MDVSALLSVFIRSERNMGATSGLATVVKVIFLFINFFGWIFIVMALKEVFKILQGVLFKNMVTIVHIILDVFLGK